MPATEVRTPSSVAAFGLVMSSFHALILATTTIAAATPVMVELIRVVSFIVVSLRLEVGREREGARARNRRGREAEPANERSLCSGVRFGVPSRVIGPGLQITSGQSD